MVNKKNENLSKVLSAPYISVTFQLILCRNTEQFNSFGIAPCGPGIIVQNKHTSFGRSSPLRN